MDIIAPPPYTEAEQQERQALGLPSLEPAISGSIKPDPSRAGSLIKKRIIQAPDVLNEAPAYGSAFPRGLRLDFPNGITELLISGTASIGANGETLHTNDFRAQCWRTFRNIGRLLDVEGANWMDVVRTTCYLRDIERDYKDFNEVRNEFYTALALDPLPASTAIQARICREDLLVEIEALAIVYRASEG